MPPTTPPDPVPGQNPPSRALLVEELERRIVEIEALGDAEIGGFAGWDWAICVTGAVVLPALALWWFAG
jgi:hypothetical protein